MIEIKHRRKYNMMQKNKIAIVVVYFGKLPNCFPLWVKSCTYNPTIDFYIFTDQNISELPANVFEVSMSIVEIRNRASSVLGFEAVLSRPYKCCDYRPLYGLIFKDYLSSYDYWGHCDIDLIFGDLQHFFKQYHLYEFDKFGVLGHLSLFKNIDNVNTAYTIPNKYINYRDVYVNEKNYAFDESLIYNIMKDAGFKVFTKRIFIDIATMYHRYRMIDIYTLDKKAINYPLQTFLWENGKVFHVFIKNSKIYREEYIYVHFQKRPDYELVSNILKYNSFYITNHGFISKQDDELTAKIIEDLNSYPGKVYEMFEQRYNSIKRRVKRYLEKNSKTDEVSTESNGNSN